MKVLTGTIKQTKTLNGELAGSSHGHGGRDGVSPTVTITDILDGAEVIGHRITITDINGTKSFDVMNGDKGVFWATYNETSFSDIQVAYNSGKIVMLSHLLFAPDNINLPLVNIKHSDSLDADQAWFYGVAGSASPYIYEATCDEGTDSWLMSRTALSTKAVTGDLADLSTTAKGNIVAAINEIASNKDVFIATYGSTTANEIASAINNGKLCVVVQYGIIYTLSGTSVVSGSGTRYIFSSGNGDKNNEITVTGSTWAGPTETALAKLVSPTFTGTPKAPTAAEGTNTTQIATTAFVQRAVSEKLDSDGNAYRSSSIPMGHLDASSTETVMTATVDGITELRDGVCMWLTNGVITSASGFTINVNSLGAKPCYSSLAAATQATTIFNANYTMLFVYNSTRVTGGCWDIVYGYDANTTYTPAKLGQGYAVCSTAAATAAKVASISSYTLVAGGIVAIKFSEDVPANATLNITSKGAKAIYYKGAAITAGIIKAGDTATFIYSTNYHLLSIDRWGSDIEDIKTRLDQLLVLDNESF